ncbi:MAG TPA: hypothetical protein VG734_06275 [Lacunisphaera sp.]|nr:hypothetical protein [Lacunisphaera sp.]
MKTIRLFPLVAVLGFSALIPARGAAAGQVPDATPAVPQPAPEVIVTPAPVIAPSATQWSDLKGFGFDRREEVFTGLKGLEASVDAQIVELAAKRESLVATNTSTQAWDLAMQGMTTARTALKSAISDLYNASRDTWDQMKDRVTDAWTRTQDAYSRVKASTTR